MLFNFRKRKIKIAVVGNCQSRPLANIFKLMNPNIEIVAIAVAHLLKQQQKAEYEAYFDDADIIVSQIISPTFPCEFIRTNELRNRYKEKLVTIVNLFFEGYTPDWFYIRIPGQGTLKGPMGDYHNKTIFEHWRIGVPASEAAKLIEDPDFNVRYNETLGKSLEALRTRENLADVIITDYLSKNYSSYRMFFTFNHPCNKLLLEYAERILEHKNIAVVNNEISLPTEALGIFKPLLNPIIKISNELNLVHHGIECHADGSATGKPVRKEYTSSEISDIFYRIYDERSDLLVSIQ